MIIWTTGIIEAEVNSAFFQTRKIVQDLLNELILNINFGNGVEKIRIVFIINRDSISEYHRFSKKEKTLDIRVRISYNEFRDALLPQQTKMFVDAIVTSISKINNFKQHEFDKDELIKLVRQMTIL